MHAANDSKPTSTVEPEVLEGGRLKWLLFVLLSVLLFMLRIITTATA
jgi:hypothetical protein